MDTVDAVDSAVDRLISSEPVNAEPVNSEINHSDDESDERTPLVGQYTPRDLLESSVQSQRSRSWRDTSSYIARVSYYSRLNNLGNLNVPYHIMSQYLVIPTLGTAYKQGKFIWII